MSTSGSKNTLGQYNPPRYRGYVYDIETGLYYLQSRYYDPETGRFVNPDAFAATGQGLLGNNMFAYCCNNAINCFDPAGQRMTAILQEDVLATGGGIAFVGPIVFIVETIKLMTTVVAQRGTSKKEVTKEQSVAIADSRSDQNYQYWEAYRLKNSVVIGRGLTFSDASIRVACGLDIMCANNFAAKRILITNGYWNCVGPEIHGDDGYYWHYHPNRNSHTHIWFY